LQPTGETKKKRKACSLCTSICEIRGGLRGANSRARAGETVTGKGGIKDNSGRPKATEEFVLGRKRYAGGSNDAKLEKRGAPRVPGKKRWKKREKDNILKGRRKA